MGYHDIHIKHEVSTKYHRILNLYIVVKLYMLFSGLTVQGKFCHKFEQQEVKHHITYNLCHFLIIPYSLLLHLLGFFLPKFRYLIFQYEDKILLTRPSLPRPSVNYLAIMSVFHNCSGYHMTTVFVVYAVPTFGCISSFIKLFQVSRKFFCSVCAMFL